jgi:hypothetical protein
MLIGFTGPAGVGKDTAANRLSRRFDNWVTVAFAGRLKAGLAAMGLPEPSNREDKEKIIHQLGFSWRHAAQTLGTEWGRKLNPHLWTILAMSQVQWRMSEGFDVAVTDVRFDNEAHAIRHAGGYIIALTGRQTTVQGAAAGHASEAGVSPDLINFTIDNSGDINHLDAQLADVLAQITRTKK